ncbi:MAG: hypothetical protein FJ143_12775, partial [Deltaproteobacteria bacterium]|nr:hypothetical protein [Deltaproteobacteria bacterium]
FPAPGEVDYHFRAAALPGAIFDLIVAGFALLIIFGWYLIYARSHGRTIRLPDWVRGAQIGIYLFLINRLYLDNLAMRLGKWVGGAIERLERSEFFRYAAAFGAAGVALVAVPQLAHLSPAQILPLIAALFLLPLFPFQGAYVAALTRLPADGAIAAAIVAPAAGLYLLANLSTDIPPALLRAIGAMALLGALYASLKALAQVRLTHLAAYASVAFYSIFWWCLAVKKSYGSEAVLYVLTVILLTAGLLLAWQRLAQRYGNLTLDRMHGLARSMPWFATLFALLIMAAAGLPPFGFFSSHFAMLAQPTGALSWGLPVILLVWFTASWYLFRMMQRLLFGPHREDLVYQDLRAGEILAFASVLLAVLLLGTAPRQSAPSQRTTGSEHTARETIAWQK